MGHPALDLSSKTAVVIGGTSGVGLTLALGLAKAGADVVATGRRQKLVQDITCEILKMGRKSLALSCDVGNRADIEMLRDKVLKELGRVDILVNSAGITQRTPVLEVGESEWNRIMETNLNGTLRACQVFGEIMIEQKYGRIINVASLASHLAFYQVAAYSASKAAVASLTKSLATEWARYGICVNALVPGVFRTDLNASMLDGTGRGDEYMVRIPMKRFGRLEELVGATIFLASDAASYVTGHLLAVDGGFLASGMNQ